MVPESSKKKRTVFFDFNETRTNVTDSNVMVYGDFRTGHETLSSFVGNKNQNKKHPSAEPITTITNEPKVSYYTIHIHYISMIINGAHYVCTNFFMKFRTLCPVESCTNMNYDKNWRACRQLRKGKICQHNYIGTTKYFKQ